MENLLLILTSTLILINGSPLLQTQGNPEQCTNLFNLNSVYYILGERTIVNGIPADLSVHWKTGNIYFTLISDEMKMTLQLLHPSGNYETIKVTGLGQSTCVDNLNDVIYLATDNGIYKYNGDRADLFAGSGEDVMYIAVTRDGTMYIATWPQNRVHKITNEGKKQEMFSAIPNGHGLTVDARNNIFFIATKTPYVLKNGYTIPIKIKGLPSDKMTGVFVSKSDKVFAMDENSNLYQVDAENANANYLGTFNVTGVNTFAMDSDDNILIGLKGEIIKFITHENNPCSDFDL